MGPFEYHQLASSASAIDLLPLLTDRDRYLMTILAENGVLTAEQITQLAYGSPITARHRLLLLVRRAVLARFRYCRRPGSSPWHYTLGHGGAVITAAQQGQDLPRPAAHAARVLRLATSKNLAHLVGVNGFFCQLAAHARTHHGCQLVTWLSERHATTECAGLAHPDGAGTWREHERTVSFFLEYDRGNESLTRLVSIVDSYRELAQSGGPAHPILIWVPSTRRQTHLHHHLRGHTDLTVATAAGDYATAIHATPADAIWRPLHAAGYWRLADLRSTPAAEVVGSPA